MNCWEFKKCGREPGGVNARKFGVCPAAKQVSFNGCNGGLNAGRSCWMISGTLCDGETQGSFLEKISHCAECGFYKLVDSEDNVLALKHKAILAANCRRGYEKKTIASKTDDEQIVLYLLQQLDSHEEYRTVKIVTLYKEIPISTKAEIMEVTKSSVVLATNELQIAAIKACQETLFGTSRLPIFFLGQIADYDLRKMTVTLNSFSCADLYINYRKAVRVRLPKPLNVSMQAGNEAVSGIIHDISHGGCGINTTTTAGLNSDDEVSLKLKFADSANGNIVEADIPCVVVRVINSQPPFKIALNFNHNAHTERVLSNFIHQRELEIIRELRNGL